MDMRVVRGYGMVVLSVVVTVWSGAGLAGQAPGGIPAPDAASLKISALSAEEIRGLREGEGMGLARPAELNGYPGPAHILEAARAGKIHLYAEQRQAIERIHAAMKVEAQALGQQILLQETALEAGFRTGRIGEADLVRWVEDIGRIRATLRLTHLRAHLHTATLLRPEQIEHYYQFRGLATEPLQRRHGH